MALTAVLYDAQNATHEKYLSAITDVHMACITDDKTIATFRLPLSRDKMESWWSARAAETRGAAAERIIVVCLVRDEGDGGRVEVEAEAVAGVVMLHMPTSETGSFRGCVEKLLVAPAWRRIGVAAAMMRKLEEAARERGRTLLVGLVLCAALLGWFFFWVLSSVVAF
jgi:GNAT superfamily N-acetyltransferase